MRLRITRALAVVGAAAAVLGAGCPDSGIPAYPTAFPATLAGHAVLPALTFIDAPADAPAEFATSGKFISGAAAELPLPGQPVQGFSAVTRLPDGSFLLLTDNGAGSMSNSADYLLMLNRYRIDFGSGETGSGETGSGAPGYGGFDWRETVFLRDPDRKVPFRIVNENTAQRYLTGADFDPESLVFAGGALWIGEEFGPYLIKAATDGRVLAVYEAFADGMAIRSPDHRAGGTTEPRLGRSKGFEGMAVSPNGATLYAMLEGPLSDDGAPVVRILEFDAGTESWTGRYWRYPLSADGHAIGDITMLDGSTALVIERDNGAGTPERACAPGSDTGCFPEPAVFKRVYKIELGESRVGGDVRKVGFIDLMAIADPLRRAVKPLTGGVLELPFPTIETLAVVDGSHIVVGNDNNLPFSRSRDPNLPDDNEMVLLEVASLLAAC